jgi:hypothetical protein
MPNDNAKRLEQMLTPHTSTSAQDEENKVQLLSSSLLPMGYKKEPRWVTVDGWDGLPRRVFQQHTPLGVAREEAELT